ncbi:MAG: hypothetical protein NTU45_11420 [Planctomycetota bacterium]|nr:hypothetical protein [Planctomycetota bacterium]
MSAVQDNPFDRNLDAFLGTRTPERKGSASASRTLVLVGNLPVLSGLWLSQFADREARERGAACMLRIDNDAVQIELFVANGRRPSIRPQATLAEALRAVAPVVSAWLVVPRAADPIEVPADVGEVVVLTGADEPAVIAAYTLVRRCVDAFKTRREGRGHPRTSVAVLGATDDECAFVERTLDKATRAFLQVDLPVRGGLQQVKPTESAFRGTFDAHSPLVEDVFAMIRAAEAASATDTNNSAASSTRFDRGERFTPRRERLAPRRSLVEPAPIPFNRGVSIPPMPAVMPAAMPATMPASAPAMAAAPAPMPAAAPRDHGAFTSVPTSVPTSAPASLPPEPITPSRARSVKGELPAQLVPELAGLEPIALRAPRDKHIELAIDADGRLHIVGRATDATAILRARGWAREHGELLSLADPRISSGERGIDPVIDLVVSDLRDARAIDGATVHVLTLVEIAGRRGYLAQIAPE